MTQTTTQLQIDGIDVFIEGAGEETIVMIHGWPNTYRLWDAQVAALKDQYRCVRFTLPGFDIGKPRRAYSMAETMAIFKNIVAQVSPGKKVILMLHDWGCMFGYRFYMQNQGLISRIIGTDVGDASTPEFAASLGIKIKLIIFYYQVWLAIAWRIGGGIGDAMTRGMARAMKARADLSLISSGMNFPYYIQWTGTYGGYKNSVRFIPECPMLFVYGTKKMFMFHSQSWADQLSKKPGCRVLPIKTDHWVMVEQGDGTAQEFNRAVQTWLGETKA